MAVGAEGAERAERRQRSSRVKRGPRLSAPARRSQILAAAVRLLAERGLDAVRIPAVAEAAGVSRPVVYRHFFSREDLIAAIAEELGRRNQEALERALESLGTEATASEIWRRTIDRYFDVIRELGPTNMRAMLIPTSEVGRRRMESWAEWVATSTGVPAPLAGSLLQLAIPMLCSYAELWLAGVLSREQAVDLPVRSLLWHAARLQGAIAGAGEPGDPARPAATPPDRAAG